MTAANLVFMILKSREEYVFFIILHSLWPLCLLSSPLQLPWRQRQIVYIGLEIWEGTELCVNVLLSFLFSPSLSFSPSLPIFSSLLFPRLLLCLVLLGFHIPTNGNSICKNYINLFRTYCAWVSNSNTTMNKDLATISFKKYWLKCLENSEYYLQWYQMR